MDLTKMSLELENEMLVEMEACGFQSLLTRKLTLMFRALEFRAIFNTYQVQT